MILWTRHRFQGTMRKLRGNYAKPAALPTTNGAHSLTVNDDQADLMKRWGKNTGRLKTRPSTEMMLRKMPSRLQCETCREGVFPKYPLVSSGLGHQVSSKQRIQIRTWTRRRQRACSCEISWCENILLLGPRNHRFLIDDYQSKKSSNCSH